MVWIWAIIEVFLGVSIKFPLQQRNVFIATFLNELEKSIHLPQIVKGTSSQVKRGYTWNWWEFAFTPWRIIDMFDYFIRVFESLYYVLPHQIDASEDILYFDPFIFCCLCLVEWVRLRADFRIHSWWYLKAIKIRDFCWVYTSCVNEITLFILNKIVPGTLQQTVIDHVQAHS